MDLLLYNGIIKTMDEKNSTYEAVGIKNNKITFLGNNERAKKLEADKKIDLGGKLLLPGFIDTHLHILHYALAESMVKLADCKSLQEVLKKGRLHLEKEGLKFGWLLGRGWNQNNFQDTDQFITKDDLDKISKEHPIFFSRVCGHMATVNSKGLEEILAMEKANKLNEYIDEETGILTESAVSLKSDLLGKITVEELEELLQKAHKDLNKAGITGIHSADFSTLPSGDWEKVIKAYKSLKSKDKLKVRTYEQAMFDNIKVINDFINKGYKTGDGSEFFKIGPLKLLADGSLGARTAYMNEPYNDDQSTRGILIFSRDELEEIFEKAHKNGLQIAVHAIGDGAIELNVDLLNEINKNEEGNPLRHGIVHAQFTNEEILKKMKKGNILAYIQPVFVGTDMEIAEDRVGKDRLKKAYAWKSMLDMGIKAPGSSDAPVESFDIMENIYNAVTRKNKEGKPAGGWLPEEKLSVEEAVSLFTTEAAYVSFEENLKGSLEKGKLADMVVLDKNIFEIRPKNIKDTEIIYTILDGEIVFKKE